MKTQNDNSKQADLKLYSAFRLLEQNNLLYFRVMKKMNFMVQPGFKAIGAVGYNQKNHKIYMMLQEEALLKGSDEDVAALCEHECGHVLYEHIFNQIPNINNQTMNMAMDIIINDSCHYITSRINFIKDEKNQSILRHGCFFVDFQKKYPELKNRSTEELTSMELYQILNKDNQEETKKQDAGFDSHDEFEIVENEDGEETAVPGSGKDTSEIKNAAKEAVQQAIEELKREGKLDKAIGQLSGNMKALVKDMLRSRTDKNSIFNFINRISLESKRKWTKLHRRYPYLTKGYRKDKKPKIGILIDSSGSMGGEEFFEMIRYQCSVLAGRCAQFYILVGDTQLQSSTFVKFKNQFKPEDIQFVGCGGTNLQFGWDFAKENNLDGLVVHTDGEIGSFDDRQVKTIFYLYGDNPTEQENYQNVRVYPE